MKDILFAFLLVAASAQAIKGVGLRSDYTVHLTRRAAVHGVKVTTAGKYASVHKHLCTVADSGVDLQLAQASLSNVVGDSLAAAYVEATTLAGCE